MDFEDFKKILVEDIKNELEHRGRTNMEVSSVHVEKINESYDAATVKEKDSHIGVNVNLNHLFDQYKANEITVTEAIFHAADIAENGRLRAAWDRCSTRGRCRRRWRRGFD